LALNFADVWHQENNIEGGQLPKKEQQKLPPIKKSKPRTHHHLLQLRVLQVPVLVADAPIASQNSPALSYEHLEGTSELSQLHYEY
jgi:hypothetical protein